MPMHPTPGWLMVRNLDRPYWDGFKVFRDVGLPQVTTRDTIHALLGLAADVVREPKGLDRLLEAYERWRATPPSEMPLLITADELARLRDGVPVVLPARAAEVPTSPPVVEPEPRTRIALRHRHSINCVFYGPGASVDVPAAIAADLLMADRRLDELGPLGGAPLGGV